MSYRLTGLAIAAIAAVLIQAKPAEAISITIGIAPNSVTLSTPGDTLNFFEPSLGNASGTVHESVSSGSIDVSMHLKVQGSATNPVGGAIFISSDPGEIFACGTMGSANSCPHRGLGFNKINGTFTGPISQSTFNNSISSIAYLAQSSQPSSPDFIGFDIGSVGVNDVGCPIAPFPCPSREPFSGGEIIGLSPGEPGAGLGLLVNPSFVNMVSGFTLLPGNGFSADYEAKYVLPESASLMVLANRADWRCWRSVVAQIARIPRRVELW